MPVAADHLASSAVSGLPVLRACEANPIAGAGTGFDQLEPSRLSGISHNSSFHCSRNECAEFFHHTFGKVLHNARGPPSPHEMRSPFQESRPPLPPASGQSTAEEFLG